jgi:hypothetical protein
MALRYGRKPPVDKPRLKLASFLKAGVIPDHPATVDYGAAIDSWQMLGNDRYGDCVAVTWANSRYLTTTYLAERATYPTLSQVLAFYKTQNPGFPSQDDGMVIQLALESLQKQGGPDGVKAIAFAEVDHTNIDEIRAAVAIFGGIWYGVDVTDTNEHEFPDRPWDYDPAGHVVGGHAIVGLGYDPNLRFITWAEETEFTDAFVQHQLEEAWVVVWPEHLGTRQFEQGIDVTKLATDFKALTGHGLPTPTPPPGAAPFLGAAPLVVQHIESSAARAGLVTADWLNRHFRTYFHLTNESDSDSIECE